MESLQDLKAFFEWAGGQPIVQLTIITVLLIGIALVVLALVQAVTVFKSDRSDETSQKAMANFAEKLIDRFGGVVDRVSDSLAELQKSVSQQSQNQSEHMTSLTLSVLRFAQSTDEGTKETQRGFATLREEIANASAASELILVKQQLQKVSESVERIEMNLHGRAAIHPTPYPYLYPETLLPEEYPAKGTL